MGLIPSGPLAYDERSRRDAGDFEAVLDQAPSSWIYARGPAVPPYRLGGGRREARKR